MATYFAGKSGSCTIGGVTYPLTNWEFNSTVQAVEVSNFTIAPTGPSYLAPNAGQEAYIPNLSGGTITCEGPLTSLGTPSNGVYATFILGVGAGLSYSVIALITEVTPSQDVKDRASVSITAQITPIPV